MFHQLIELMLSYIFIHIKSILTFLFVLQLVLFIIVQGIQFQWDECILIFLIAFFIGEIYICS